MNTPDTTGSEEMSADNVKREQKLRLQRLGMSFISYLVTFSIVVYCWVQA